MKYRKKPVEVKAFRWMVDITPDWFKEAVNRAYGMDVFSIVKGHWIIKETDKKLYTLPYDQFQKEFEFIDNTTLIARLITQEGFTLDHPVSEFIPTIIIPKLPKYKLTVSQFENKLPPTFERLSFYFTGVMPDSRTMIYKEVCNDSAK
jgi:hypothetical protein